MVLRPACRRTRRQLWDYSQQTVREDALEEMERHLRQCAGCRSEAAAYRHAIACLTATRQQPQPVVPDTWLAVRERLHRPVVAPRRDRRIGTLLALGATLCAVLIGDRMSERHRPTALAGAGGGDHAQPSPSPGGRDAHVDSAGLVALPQLPRRASVPRGLQPEARRALRGTPAPHFPAVVEDDLAYLNRSPGAASWSPVRPDELEAIKARIDRTVRAGDAFIEVPFPRLAANDRQLIAAAAVAYAREKATVDPRLAKQVRLSVRGISLSELCRSLSERTSIRLSADRSVADQKVTLFVTDQPLREIMAQLSRLFGFTWSRSRRPTAEADEYQYELTQGLRAQLLEEELRNRELNEALLALDLELRRPLPEGPAVPPADLSRVSLQERTRLERLAEQRRWAGANRLYQRLSPAQVAALRAGQTVEFSTEAEQAELRIPDELRHSLLQAHGSFRHYTADGEFVDDDTGMTLAEVPSAGVSVAFSLEQREPGRLSLRIEPGFTLVRHGVRIPIGGRGSSEIALGASPAARPDNAARNRALRQDPQFRRRVSVEPKPHCRFLLQGRAALRRPLPDQRRAAGALEEGRGLPGGPVRHVPVG
ncbi:MAG: hypothetical protein K0Q72_5055 [Armatimonadetes bacterium]|nr:hypothetical protein [Armatimonadota bacterium]